MKSTYLTYLRHIAPHIILCIWALFIHQLYAAGVTGIGSNGSGVSQLAENSIIRPDGGDFASVVQRIAIQLFDAVRIILYGIALLAMLYVGFLWVTSMGDEERQNDGKYRILLIIIGLFIINVAELIYTVITGSSYLDDNFGRKVSSISTRDPGGSFNESELDRCNYFFCPQNFWWNGSVLAVIKFLEVTMIATAVVMFTWGWFMLLLRGDDEHANQQAKMRLVYWTIAIIVVGFIEAIYRAIFFGWALNATGLMRVLVMIANFAIFMAGPIGIIMIIIGAYFYITSAGDEERADRGKKILLYTFLATILLILSYTFLVEIVWLNLF
jgi:Type IV secretion system pilin